MPRIYKIYLGFRSDAYSLVVTVDHILLKARPDLLPRITAPFFECGYIGNGPKLLSVSILADLLHDDVIAVAECVHFESNIISKLQRSQSWFLTSDHIRSALFI